MRMMITMIEPHDCEKICGFQNPQSLQKTAKFAQIYILSPLSESLIWSRLYQRIGTMINPINANESLSNEYTHIHPDLP